MGGCHSEREYVNDEGTHEQSRDAFTRALRALAQAEEDGKAQFNELTIQLTN